MSDIMLGIFILNLIPLFMGIIGVIGKVLFILVDFVLYCKTGKCFKFNTLEIK